ncbi:DUF2726 domain-containing protein [Bremerella sp. T1]|uniref:DUF2726 domain-containing protein n=1 Tax=Bremerella sp. TYQ1 TaxID=3119568 RepID=UPI001CCBCF78|nr:DUF2726 domain-containing protein [Bremerella volcania]UBM33723.1 DUF2726 domain-containing protein [Bremerella volcania]
MFGVNLASGIEPTSQTLPYLLRDDFLSPAELSFFHVLRKAVSDKYIVIAKVNLADILFVPGKENISYRNRIDRKHVDFVLCDPVSMQPICAVELDDRSHRQADRQQRDELVDAALAATGLPLIRVPAKRGYNVENLREILATIPLQDSQRIEPVSPPSGEVPICPKCQTSMKRQTARRGANAGKQFWGCSNYPKCRETMDISG